MKTLRHITILTLGIIAIVSGLFSVVETTARADGIFSRLPIERTGVDGKQFVFIGRNDPQIYTMPGNQALLETALVPFRNLIRTADGDFHGRFVTAEYEAPHSDVLVLFLNENDYQKNIKKYGFLDESADNNGCSIRVLNRVSPYTQIVLGVLNPVRLQRTGIVECIHLLLIYHFGVRVDEKGRNISHYAGKGVPARFYHNAASISLLETTGEISVTKLREQLSSLLRLNTQ